MMLSVISAWIPWHPAPGSCLGRSHSFGGTSMAHTSPARRKRVTTTHSLLYEPVRRKPPKTSTLLLIGWRSVALLETEFQFGGKMVAFLVGKGCSRVISFISKVQTAIYRYYSRVDSSSTGSSTFSTINLY